MSLSSTDRETGTVFPCSSNYFYLIFRFLQIAVSIKAREIHFKRGQIEDYVGVAIVQVSYCIFSRALLKALAIGTLIACLTINSSKQKSKQKSNSIQEETPAIQNSFSNIQYFSESSSIFDFFLA